MEEIRVFLKSKRMRTLHKDWEINHIYVRIDKVMKIKGKGNKKTDNIKKILIAWSHRTSYYLIIRVQKKIRIREKKTFQTDKC